MKRIPVAGPWITQREIDYVTDAVTTCWYDKAGRYHQQFEQAFAKYIGTRYAVSLPSCTSGIHLSLAALGIGPGDEVILPDVTWIASAAPVSYLGATPVFADIDEHTWCLSPRSFEECITAKTKAVIPVDLYGSMAEMDRLREVADRYSVAVIEDAAEAFGSQIGERMAGSFGDTGVFSFHGSKTMTTGEGGMLVTDRTDIYDRVCFLRDHGRQPGDVSFRNREVAYKYKMSSMQAALGLAQVERADELVARKREIFFWYQEYLSSVKGIALNPLQPGVTSSYWMSTLLLDPALNLHRDALAEQLASDGIDTRPFFHPLSSIPAYQQRETACEARNRNPVAYRLSARGLNLPCALNMTREQAEFVSSRIKAIIRGCSRRVA